MSALRQEILEYIDDIPDNKLEIIKPLLSMMANDTLKIETDLTEEEKDIIKQGREEYKKYGAKSFSEIRNL